MAYMYGRLSFQGTERPVADVGDIYLVWSVWYMEYYLSIYPTAMMFLSMDFLLENSFDEVTMDLLYMIHNNFCLFFLLKWFYFELYFDIKYFVLSYSFDIVSMFSLQSSA